MNELALFAGAGGGILGGKLLGWRTVCAVERDSYAAQILAQRQNDGVLEPFPIWSDVCSFDGKPWRGIVDVVSGGFPCQDISAAGKGAGIEGERSGMWKEMARIIGEVRPKYAFVENSPMLTTRGLGVVLADLASLGFDAEWGVLSAADVGAPHRRERIWILGRNSKRELADTNLCRHQNGQTEINTTNARLDAQRISGASGSDVAHTKSLHSNAGNNNGKNCECEISKFRNNGCQKDLPNTNCTQRQRVCKPIGIQQERADIGNPRWWEAEPNVGRVADGVAFTVDRLKAIGNGQVPLCASTAFELLRARFE